MIIIRLTSLKLLIIIRVMTDSLEALMKLQFLCTHHRQWLTKNPVAAMRTWQEAFDRSHELVATGRLKHAANHAGCAMETSDIVLEHAADLEDADITRFSASSTLLADLLCQLGESDMAHVIIQGALQRLEAMLKHNQLHEGIRAGFEELSSSASQMRNLPAPVHRTIH